jgi:L-alanine-DL-glutamate epimerase-like enolase superfamily enzyme
VQLTWRPFQLKLAHPWTIARTLRSGARSRPELFDVVFLELNDGGGLVGLGEAAPSLRYGESVETVMTCLARVDPQRLSFRDVAGSMRYLDTLSEGNAAAKCALNIALLDGAARHAGQSLCDFLGLGFTEHKHVTSFSIGLDRPEVIRKKVAQAAAFSVLKLKLGGPDDRSNLSALRDVAPDKRVRVDANEAWTSKEEALRHIEWLAADRHIEFVEQPMPATTPLADLAWLKQRSSLPLLADECYVDADDLARCREGYHGVNVKLVKAGGISRSFQALQAARAAGLQAMIGCMIESSILITAAAHLAELADYLDLDGSLLVTNDPYQGVTAKRGVLSFASAPEKTGLRVRARPAG